ncbi:Putative 15-hydroxyprostaglandin dehydrogenase (NAD()) (AFU_orthologue; AFUA_3G09480) [Aspergillus calidoustus]|uniref:Putative 15-hydroxyprostaglandin dehydrogenase (NAD( )) (AFU_orthologue AFUA_3G09480) n=1 Tax=Aspergillus calidoustus TaxID=454130 RepID=A0A0U5FS34_ASPCI|nr:Putative 15-hydroxyprostaglandin dehydrogenase (NAD()) (AFU_orthologue; AFUA_3G09480) [Aspergillus calidoustus]
MGSHVEDRVAILVGATSGMGIDIAQDLAARGWKVACVGRRREAGEALLKTIPGENARFFPADVSNYEEYANVFREVRNLWGRIDALCANAGIVDTSSVYIYDWKNKSVDDVPPAPDLSVVDTNYKGVVYGTQLATHFMRHNPVPGGRIVITGSIGAVFPHRTYPVYCGTKAAVNHFVRGMAPLLKQKENILINVVMPGIVATPIVPPEMIAAVTPECITPVETVLKAYQVFLEDTTGMAGEILECSAHKLIYYRLPEYGNGAITKRAVTVWEPLFRMMHGEDSQLPDAIP